MRVKVEKQFLLRFYLLIREVGRSLHSALSTDWHELRCGYPSEKIEGFREAIQEFAANIDLDAVNARTSEAIANRLAAAAPNLFRMIFRSWLWKRAKTIRFGEEARFVATFLQQIADVLARETPPAREELIALRMRTSDVERIIQFRCCAIDEQPGPRPIWSVQDRAWREKHGLPLDYRTLDAFPREKSKGVTAPAQTIASSD